MALLVALGSSSYAALRVGSAQIVDNSVRSRDIRNNDIRGKDVRNGTIRGSDVARNTLTGLDIRESSLGVVPVAGSAVVASTTRSVRTVGVTTVREGAAAVTLASYGPFRIVGSCAAGGTSTVARVSLASTEPSSSLAARDSSAGSFGPSDGAQPIQEVSDDAGGTPTPSLGYDDTFAAFAPNGRAISGLVSPGADADAGASGVCRFFGGFIVEG